MDTEIVITRHKQISNLIEILQGYILEIDRQCLTEEYYIESAYFKCIIKGLIIDDKLPNLLKNQHTPRPIFTELKTQHITTHKIGENGHTNMDYIEIVFKRLYDKEKPLRNNLFFYDSIPEVSALLILSNDHVDVFSKMKYKTILNSINRELQDKKLKYDYSQK